MKLTYSTKLIKKAIKAAGLKENKAYSKSKKLDKKKKK